MRDTQFGTQASHRHHHGFRTAHRHGVKFFSLQNGVVRHETALAERTVFGRDANASPLFKLGELHEVTSGATAQKKGDTLAGFAKTSAVVEKRSRAHAAADKQHVLAHFFRRGETVAQGIDAVQEAALFQTPQRTSPLAHFVDEKPEAIVFHIVH